jgi:hypothetical protein
MTTEAEGKTMSIYPKNSSNHVSDVAFQLFSCGMVWDGNLSSKAGRDYLVEHGYAVRRDGFQALTGKGTVAFLLHWRTWHSAFLRWRNWKRNPFIATPEQVERSVS